MTKTGRLIETFGRQIAQGEFKPSTPLPSEAELCERFGMSRNAMREAIKVLSTKSLIDAQPHHGLMVMPQEQWNYLDADVLAWVLEKGEAPDLIHSLVEVRCLIEPMISRWAAERATAIDLVEIEASFNDMDANREDLIVFNEADIRFHKAILLASRNVVICQLSSAISALQRAIFNQTLSADPQHMAQTVKSHGDLLNAIRCKQKDRAEEVSRGMVEDTAYRARKIEV